MAAPNWKNIDFEELIESGVSEQYSADSGDNLTRVFKVLAGHRRDFAFHVFNSASDGFGAIVYPGTRARANTVNFSPFPPNDHNIFTPTVISDIESQIYLHNYVRAEIAYATVQSEEQDSEDLPDGTYATYKMNWTGEFIELPGRHLRWEGTGEKVKDDAFATKLIPRTQHVVTWNRVTNPPWSAISKCRGRVNKTKFKIPATKQTIGPQTLLFMGAEPEITFTTEDQSYWSLVYTFEEKSVTGLKTPDGWYPPSDDPMAPPPVETVYYGWNHIWNDATGEWTRARVWNGTDGDAADMMYDEEEFKDLFEFQIYPV